MVCRRNTYIDSYVIPDIIGNKIAYINTYTIIVYVLVCSTALAISGKYNSQTTTKDGNSSTNSILSVVTIFSSSKIVR